MERLIQLARSYAVEFMSGAIEPAHLLRACLHPNIELVDWIETTLEKDYYYLVDWAEAQISLLDKKIKQSEPQLSELSETVLREADNYRSKIGCEETDAICVMASLVTPGVGFTFEQLKTLPLTVQEILQSLEKKGKPSINAGDIKRTNITGKNIAKYCRNLLNIAEGCQWTIVGFEKEISTLFEVFGRQSKANVLVTGDSGVGKTSLVHGFVNRIRDSKVPEHLKTAQVYELNLSEMSSGASYKGEVEDRTKSVLAELSKIGNVVLVIESLDKVLDKQDPLYGIVNILKQYIEKGDILLLCTSSIDGYTRNIEKEKEFSNKFERIVLEPPTDDKCFRIVKGSIGKYEDFHSLTVSDDVIKEAIRLSKRYITERPLPDSAFDLLDRTMAQVVIMNDMAANDVADFKRRLTEINGSGEIDEIQLDWLHYEFFNKISYLLTLQIENENDYYKCETLDGKKQYLIQVIEELEKKASVKRREVQTSDLSSVVAKLTGIPMGKVQSKERDKLINGEQILKQRVIGQDHAIKVVLDAVYESRSGLNKKGQPIGSFFFLGPTGTGKTELSKTLVEFLFGDENALIRFDMSEFKEEHSVALLYGAPPGYVGYEEGGLLVNKIRQNPYSVVLFDEIEKAHKSVFDLFLQILDEGKLHDRLGRVGDFSNALILFTSNIGSQFIVDSFNNGHIPQSNELMDIMQGHFRPEFLGRLTEIVPFAPISEQTVVKIFDIHLRNLCKQLDEQHITLEMEDECKRAIAMNGFNPQYGARPIIGIIRKELRRPLSTMIIRGEVKGGDTVIAQWVDGKVIFTSKI